MNNRIGVFICECGPNIKDRMDIPDLLGFGARLESVGWTESVGLLCGPDARRQVAAAIRNRGITHVVFAGCSPREHEHTLQGILEAAGLNPFLMQVANIREQCAWVIKNRDQATKKARALIQAAVRRVQRHEPLIVREIEVRPDVLVIGAGVAGISAARTLAQQNRHVFLVERSACIGGNVARYENVFPGQNCASCLIEPDLDAVLHDQRIDVLTLCEVESIRGLAGNFIVSIKNHPRLIDVDRCIGCGACMDVCPEKIPNDTNAYLDQRPAVHIPYPGALPHVANIDRRYCRRFRGESCSACRDACPFAAVDYDQAGSSRDLKVGAVVIATGFGSFDVNRSDRYGHPGMADILGADAFERLVNSTGPTGGRIVTAAGRPPDSVAFLHCVGSRNDAFNPYCSGVCCQCAIKHALQVKSQLPDTTVHHFFTDMCLPGPAAQRLFDQLRTQSGVAFHRMNRPDAVRIVREHGKTLIRSTTAAGRIDTVETQLVVLATAMEPARDTPQMAQRLDIDLDEVGFFKAPLPLTAPMDSSREGIYLAGCCRGPMDIPTAVAQGQAAAGRILQNLVPGGKIALEPIVAHVDPDICSGCRICVSLCPYGAVTGDIHSETVTIAESICRGCGICAAGCSAGAISICHFSYDAITEEIDGLLGPDGD